MGYVTNGERVRRIEAWVEKSLARYNQMKIKRDAARSPAVRARLTKALDELGPEIGQTKAYLFELKLEPPDETRIDRNRRDRSLRAEESLIDAEDSLEYQKQQGEAKNISAAQKRVDALRCEVARFRPESEALEWRKAALLKRLGEEQERKAKAEEKIAGIERKLAMLKAGS